MQTLSKILIQCGVFLLLAGLILRWLPKDLGTRLISMLGHLPGDIIIKKDHFHFYFPLTTSLLISALLFLLSLIIR